MNDTQRPTELIDSFIVLHFFVLKSLKEFLFFAIRAALKIALFSDFKHFYNKVRFYLTIYATILFSSIISFGLNFSKLCVDLILSSVFGFVGNSLSIILRRSSKDI